MAVRGLLKHDGSLGGLPTWRRGEGVNGEDTRPFERDIFFPLL